MAASAIPGDLPKIVVASSEDWEQLFVDGVSVEEGHSLSVEQVLTALGFPNRSIWYMEPEVQNGTAHPQTISEDEVQGHLNAAFDQFGNKVETEPGGASKGEDISADASPGFPFITEYKTREHTVDTTQNGSRNQR